MKKDYLPKDFWPQHHGDNQCPQCGGELFITKKYGMDSEESIYISYVYELRCFDCGEKYLADDGTLDAYEVKLREVRSPRF